jgi:hypothetical protein
LACWRTSFFLCQYLHNLRVFFIDKMSCYVIFFSNNTFSLNLI